MLALVGVLRPNQFGLFDSLGNAYEWSLGPPEWDTDGSEDRPIIDAERVEAARDSSGRMIRGAIFFRPAEYIRSAFRQPAGSRQVHDGIAFRVVKTMGD